MDVEVGVTVSMCILASMEGCPVIAHIEPPIFGVMENRPTSGCAHAMPQERRRISVA